MEEKKNISGRGNFMQRDTGDSMVSLGNFIQIVQFALH